MGFFDIFKGGQSKAEPSPELLSAVADVVDEAEEASDEFVLADLSLSHQLVVQLRRDAYLNLLQSPSMKTINAAQTDKIKQFCEQLLEDQELRISSTPSMPDVLPQLMRALRNESVNKEELSELIAQDPKLAASVLKACESTLYNPMGKKVDSFERAVVILGMAGLKVIACMSLLKPIAERSGSSDAAKKLWEITLRAAVCAQLLEEDKAQNFQAYLTGLFSSIGELVLFFELPNLVPSKDLHKSAYDQVLSQYSYQLTLKILDDWELGDKVKSGIQNGVVDESSLLSKAQSLSYLIQLCNDYTYDEHKQANLLALTGINESFVKQVNEMAQGLGRI